MAKKKQPAGQGGNPVVGLVQMSCDERPDKNLKKALERIDDAARRGAFQTIFGSGDFMLAASGNSHGLGRWYPFSGSPRR